MQISLPKAEYEAAKKEAKRKGISLAEFLRRALRQALPAPYPKPWMRFCGLVESGNPGASRDVDSIYDVLQ